MTLIFFSNVNKNIKIAERNNAVCVPNVEEHVYILKKEYKVSGIVHNYDSNCIELYLQPLNKNYITYKS